MGRNSTHLESAYKSKEELIGFFSKHLQDYQNMLKQAETVDEVTTAIVIFISVLEASHYFTDGNNRLFCQQLINKLLLEQGLSQIILDIPNGFSRYVLGILPWNVRLGIVDVADVPVSTLRERLELAMQESSSASNCLVQ